MKSILLTSTALVAFAGAAAAEAHSEAGVSFAGNATMGYNTTGDLAPAGSEAGFYWDATLATTLAATLDNGLTASATFEVEVANGNTGTTDLDASSFVLSLSSDTASLSLGDLDPVAESRWGGVDGATTADFNNKDLHFDVAGFEAMLVGEATIAGFTAAVSYGVDADGTTSEDALDAMQIHAAGTFGDFGVQFAYQQEFAGTPTIFAIGGSASFAGADISVSYVDDETTSSTGIGVSYPVGPVVLGGYYSINDIEENNYGVSADYVNGPISVSAAYDIDGGENGADNVGSYELNASYDVGNGIVVLAGFNGSNVDGVDMGYYAAATYDLGGGASVLMSYADDGDDAVLGEDLGGPEYKEGTTVEVSFSF